MDNFIQEGHRVTVTFPYAVNTGGGVQVVNVFGVACVTQAISTNGDIQLTGVFDLAKDTSTFANDGSVYWNNTTKLCTSSPNGTLHIGEAVLDTPSGTNAAGALTGDVTVRVRLNGTFGTGSITSPIRYAHFLYNFAVDGGASVTPSMSDTIPANAVVGGGGYINSPTAVTAAGSATVAIGTTAGSSSTSILAATGKASFSLDAVVVPTSTATPFKMSAAGQITLTIATGPLTAGIIEGWVPYTVASLA